MDEYLELAELNDVDLHLLLMAATILFPNASQDRVFRQLTEEAQRRGWTNELEDAATHRF